MIILDTNVLSALMYHTPDHQVVSWLDQQPRMSIWTTSVTVLEVRFGLQIMAAGKRRSLLVQAFDRLLEAMTHLPHNPVRPGPIRRSGRPGMFSYPGRRTRT